VLTGQNDSASALQAVRLNAFDYLSKPVASEALSLAIDRARLFHHKHSQLCANSQVPVYVVADATYQDVPKQIKDEGMKRLLRTVLTETRHNVSEAARRLNMTREHLYYYLKKYEIERPKH
jgi:DNA-binding NtrC family response regulator